MNIELLEYCLKGLRKRWKEVLRTSIVIFIAFTFVAGTLIFQSNMYKWQIQSAKSRFGSWYVMYEGSVKAENNDLKNHPYLGTAGLAQVNNYVYNSVGKTDISIGTLSDRFIEIGNIKLNKGRMPAKDNEIAVEWSTLIKLEQGSDIGQDIVIDTYLNGTSDKLTKTYKLVGILNSYTDVWQGGDKLPGIIVTESEGKAINRYGGGIFIYPINDYIKEDYRDIYNGIEQKVSHIYITYNSSVYDYKPWKDNYVYKYMYIVVMILAIAAIIYQLISYNKARSRTRSIVKNIGAGNVQMAFIIIIENAVILISSLLLCLIFSIVVGKAVCIFIEHKCGFEFYSIDNSVYVNTFLTFIIAVIMCCVINIIQWSKRSRGQSYRVRKYKKPRIRSKSINKDNYICYTHKRLMQSHGAVQNILTRVFGILMLVIIVVCAMNISVTYKNYNNITKSSDIIAFKKVDKKGYYNINYIYNPVAIWTNEMKEKFSKDSSYLLIAKQNGKVDNVTKEEYFQRSKNIPQNNDSGIIYTYGNVVIEKYADAYMYQGIDEHIIDYIKGISGIKDVQYSCFETSRMWTWEGWNIQEAKSVNNNYLYAAEYVEPSYEIYNILIDYAKDCDFSYEDFCNGDAVIVFEEPNIHGGYDSTIGKDTKINLMNYCSFPKGSTSYDSSYGGEYYENLYEYMYNNGMITVNDNYKSFNEDYLTSDITTEELDKRCREIMNIDENIQVSRSVAEGIVGNTILNEYEYDTLFAPAAVTRAANVVYVNDEIKERLKEYIPEYAKYTMVASNKLGQRAVDRQNELLRNLLGMEELPETITLAMKYNQINVKYSLGSVNLSTGNNLQSYLGPAGFSYYVYSDDKDDARREAIVNYILYGVSLAAAVFVYIAVSLVILVTRMKQYKDIIRVMRNTGADREVIEKICMKECIVLSLWCIILAPVTLVAEYLVIHKIIKGY